MGTDHRADPIRIRPLPALLSRLDPVLLRRAAAALVRRPGEYGDLFLEELLHGEVVRRQGRTRASSLGGWTGAAARRIDAAGDVRHHAAAGLDEASIAAMPGRLRDGDGAAEASAGTSVKAPLCDPDRLDSLARYLQEVETGVLEALATAGLASVPDREIVLSARAELRSQRVAIASSEGEVSEESRDWAAFSVRLAVVGRGDQPLEAVQAGGARDPERIRALHPPRDVAARLAAALSEAESAAVPPTGEMAIILGPGAGGILFHEACGHALEGDRALRDRSALGALLGETVGPKDLTLVDDPTLDGLPGSRRFDDEGWPAARTVLIDAGRVAGLLLDRATALRAGTAPTGSARRESYRDLPLPRMTNTFVTEGTRSPEEVLAAVSRGVYVEELGAGRADTASADFSFRVRRGFLVAGGRRVAPLKACVVSGNGLLALSGIRMIGADLRFDEGAGECGKEGQRARAAVGQPTILLEGLSVRPA
jgi:TldD protein